MRSCLPRAHPFQRFAGWDEPQLPAWRNVDVPLGRPERCTVAHASTFSRLPFRIALESEPVLGTSLPGV